MKNQKGITLIALVVTIIVLLILAGVSIAMLTGKNGVLNRAEEASYENIIGDFDENVKLAQIALKAHITSNMVSKPGYLATAGTQGKYNASEATGTNAKNFAVLTKEVIDELKAITTLNEEGYTVTSFLDTVGTSTTDGVGYIVICYTNNKLRSSLPNTLNGDFTAPTSAASTITLGQAQVTKATKQSKYSVNEASLCYVIRVENYDCKLSNMILTDNSTVTDTLGKSAFTTSSILGKTYGSGTNLKFTYVTSLD